MAYRFVDEEYTAKAPQQKTKSFRFVEEEPPESIGKSIARTTLQVPQGLLKRYSYPLDILQQAGIGHAIDEEELEHLEAIAKREGVPFDRQKYLEGVQAAADVFPTQGNIAGAIEKQYGVPLTPKTSFQKGVNLASTAAGFTPGSLFQKGVAATTAPLTAKTLESVGVPESIAEMIGLGVGGVVGAKSPSVSVTKQTKPSGLPIRQYESLKDKTTVSSSTKGKINSKVENDFRTIYKDLVESSPSKQSYNKIKNNTAYKEQSSELFRDVEELASNIKDTIAPNNLKNKIGRRINKNKSLGITPDEYSQEYQSFMKRFQDSMREENLTPVQLVQQYRINNKSLGEIYEQGKSSAYNRAKKDAILDYNRSIAEAIENEYPNSQFAKLFKESNRRWTEIMDVETIEKFLDDVFANGIDFGKASGYYKKSRTKEAFGRILGEENAGKFDQLMKDFMTTEQANKLMKTATEKGWKELAKHLFFYSVRPWLGAGMLVKDVYRRASEALLSKPNLIVTWDSAIKDAKAGRYSEATKKFRKLDKEIHAVEPDEIIVPPKKA